MIKFLKRKELILIAGVYGLSFTAVMLFKTLIQDWVIAHSNYYGWLSFLVFILIIVVTILEIVIRVVGYGMQGDKLNIKIQQGVDIEGIKNGKK